MPLLTRGIFLGLAKETTMGTAVPPTTFIPTTKQDPEDLVNDVDDDSMFGQVAKTRNVYAGVTDSTFDFDGYLFPEAAGNLLSAIGLFDVTTGSNPYTHTFKTQIPRTVADAATTNASTTVSSATAAFIAADVGKLLATTNLPAGTTISSVTNGTTVVASAAATATGAAQSLTIGTVMAQPPTYTLTEFNDYEARAYPGSMLDSLDITIDNKGIVKYAAKWKGWASAAAATPTNAPVTSAPMMGWQAAATIGGTAMTRMISANISIKRTVEAIHTLAGTRNPSSTFSGPFDADIKCKTLVESAFGNTEWSRILSATQAAFLLTLTQPNSGPVLTITATNATWKKSKSDRGSEFMQFDNDLRPNYNATDGGELQAVLSNVATPAVAF